MTQQSQSTEQPAENAGNWLQRTAENEDKEVLYERAQRAQQNTSVSEILSWLITAADKGHPKAQQEIEGFQRHLASARPPLALTMAPAPV